MKETDIKVRVEIDENSVRQVKIYLEEILQLTAIVTARLRELKEVLNSYPLRRKDASTRS